MADSQSAFEFKASNLKESSIQRPGSSLNKVVVGNEDIRQANTSGDNTNYESRN